MGNKRLLIGIVLSFAVLFILGFLYLTAMFAPQHLQPSSYAGKHIDMSKRPDSERRFFDYAAQLHEAEESAERYLKSLARFGIDGVIVTISSTPEKESTSEFAASLLSKWRVGENGRGLLLLFVDDRKEVKLEVSYELEDVFTDLFTGHIADKQLASYYRSGDPGTGLIAVMEEIEQRAQIKHLGQYSTDSIAGLDSMMLSGGAGAKRNLESYPLLSSAKEQKRLENVNVNKAETPLEAFSIMISKWSKPGSYPNHRIYTASTAFAYQNLGIGGENNPDRRTQSEGRERASKKPKAIQDGRYGLVYFGETSGWDNSPFLFSRTEFGWQWDIVAQRKYVTMGQAPNWHIQWAVHGWSSLLGKFHTSLAKDMPLEPEERYDPSLDTRYVQKIIELEKKVREEPQNFEAIIELAKLNVITSRRAQHVYPLLKTAKRLSPQSAQPYKYLAINHVDSRFQYKTALKEYKEYVIRSKQSAHTHDFLGFLYVNIGDEAQAIREFEAAVKLSPGDCYAHSKLSRIFAKKALEHNPDSRTFKNYREKVLEHFRLAGNANPVDLVRVAKLSKFLEGNKLH